MYGLRNEIPHFRSCLNVILDIADHSMDPKAEATLDQHVMDLYGLIHARYILTKRGMDKMVRLALLWRLNLGFWNGSSSTIDAVASRKTF